ncbi:DUF6777 domain-containing protein [Actinomadura rugatobispora]|uniref:DUF6777 domain-containing protein n=1 Tax=Actinomadura rugatobispora TaxID=1994 RepID=A0ABW1ACC1_9ACTN|nr:hypothetical protein GCM10010200_004500 [Actinomadura rugatobispora]
MGTVKNIGRRVALGSLAGVFAIGGVSTAYSAFADGQANADTITRMTVGTPGAAPYTPTAGTDHMSGSAQTPGTGLPGTGPATGSGQTPGTELPGTGPASGYRQTPGTELPGTGPATGSVGHSAPCDPVKLAATLQAQPAKAQAWADAHGISTQQIPGYLSHLTPTYLKTDTLVMNHSYQSGKDTSTTAVLQAGMGVLVDQSGAPVVKCNCGNPLTRPSKDISTKDATYIGPMWNGFSKEHVAKPYGGQTGNGNGTWNGNSNNNNGNGNGHGTWNGNGNGNGNGTWTTKKRPRTYQEYIAWCKGVKGPAPDVDCTSPPPPPGQTGQQQPGQQGQQPGQTGPGSGGRLPGSGTGGSTGTGGTQPAQPAQPVGPGQSGQTGSGQTGGTGQSGSTGQPGGAQQPGGVPQPQPQMNPQGGTP